MEQKLDFIYRDYCNNEIPYTLEVGGVLYKVEKKKTKADCQYNQGSPETCGFKCFQCKPGVLIEKSVGEILIKSIKADKTANSGTVTVNGIYEFLVFWPNKRDLYAEICPDGNYGYRLNRFLFKHQAEAKILNV